LELLPFAPECRRASPCDQAMRYLGPRSMPEYPTSTPRVHAADPIPRSALDPDAVRVVDRLQEAGFEAYLVGGCVRDLLLGRSPKDFDVATSARPRQVRRLFRNCRIIGRRFKLAHVVFRRQDGTEHIVETATFRRAPRPSDVGPDGTLLITDDNVFGTAAEDAARRDFTINALFFDPRTWRILDFVGGLSDLRRGRIETIGDPNVRLREDPVRILRAVKFASRLGFRIVLETYEAMATHAADLEKAATARLLEEILRLLRSGHAYAAFRLLAQCGALSVILPEIAEYLEHEGRRGAAGQLQIDLFWRDLEALDEAVREGQSTHGGFLDSVLFYRLFERELDPARRRRRGPARGPIGVADEIFDEFARRLRAPRYDVSCAKHLCSMQTRFLSRPRKKFRPQQLVSHPLFVDALALFRAHCAAANANWEIYDAWYELYRRLQGGRRAEADAEAVLHRLPAEPASFEEMWGLPQGPVEEPGADEPEEEESEGESEEAEVEPSTASAPANGNGAEPPAALPAAPTSRPEALPAAEPQPIAEPAPAARVEDDPWKSPEETSPKSAVVVPRRRPRAPRERPRFKILRPDARFEFPGGPIVKLDEPPTFGDW